MKTFLLRHWANVVLTSDGDVKDAQLFVKVRDEHDNGDCLDHVRSFKITGLEEFERTTEMVPKSVSKAASIGLAKEAKA